MICSVLKKRGSGDEHEGEQREQREEDIVSESCGALLTIDFDVNIRCLNDGAPRPLQSVADRAAHADD